MEHAFVMCAGTRERRPAFPAEAQRSVVHWVLANAPTIEGLTKRVEYFGHGVEAPVMTMLAQGDVRNTRGGGALEGGGGERGTGDGLELQW